MKWFHDILLFSEDRCLAQSLLERLPPAADGSRHRNPGLNIWWNLGNSAEEGRKHFSSQRVEDTRRIQPTDLTKQAS